RCQVALLESLYENVDTSTSDGCLSVTLLGALPQRERDSIAERTRAGQDAAPLDDVRGAWLRSRVSARRASRVERCGHVASKESRQTGRDDLVGADDMLGMQLGIQRSDARIDRAEPLIIGHGRGGRT